MESASSRGTLLSFFTPRASGTKKARAKDDAISVEGDPTPDHPTRPSAEDRDVTPDLRCSEVDTSAMTTGAEGGRVAKAGRRAPVVVVVVEEEEGKGGNSKTAMRGAGATAESAPEGTSGTSSTAAAADTVATTTAAAAAAAAAASTDSPVVPRTSRSLSFSPLATTPSSSTASKTGKASSSTSGNSGNSGNSSSSGMAAEEDAVALPKFDIEEETASASKSVATITAEAMPTTNTDAAVVTAVADASPAPAVFESAASSAASSALESAEPENFAWAQFESDEGIPYFHNATTGQSLWELPPETLKEMKAHEKRLKRKRKSKGGSRASTNSSLSSQSTAASTAAAAAASSIGGQEVTTPSSLHKNSPSKRARVSSEEKSHLQAQKEAEKAVEKERAASERARLKAERDAEKARLKAEKEAERARLKAERDAEKARELEEKARLRVEKEAERLRLKAEREAEKTRLAEERARQREVEAKERAEKKEAERLRKEAERERKEEERLQRKQEQEELKRREQEERIRAKEAQAEAKKKPVREMANFMSRFVVVKDTAPTKADKVSSAATASSRPHFFAPFQLRENMTLAPVSPWNERPSVSSLDEKLTRGEALPVDEAVLRRDLNSLVMRAARRRQKLADTKAKVKMAAAAASATDAQATAAETAAAAAPADHGVIVMENGMEIAPSLSSAGVAATQTLPTMKLLQFYEDVRPPYFGTFVKRDKGHALVSGRRPFGRSAVLDYEYDSEAEWEPEPEDAVDVEQSAGEEEEEEGLDGEEVGEDDWMVPHGYLSEDEGIDGGAVDSEGEMVLSEEEKEVEGEEGSGTVARASKADRERRKRRAAADEAQSSGAIDAVAEPKKSFTVGCIWGRAASQHPVLGKYNVVPLVATPIDVHEPPPVPTPAKEPYKPQKAEVADELVPAFVRLIHGRLDGMDKLISDFLSTLSEGVSVHKSALVRKLKDSSFVVKETRVPYNKPRWFVLPAVIESCGLGELPLPEPVAASAKPDVTDEFLCSFARHIHGRFEGMDKLITEYLASLSEGASVPTRAALFRKLKDATYVVKENREGYCKPRWFVTKAATDSLGLGELPLPAPTVVVTASSVESISLTSGANGAVTEPTSLVTGPSLLLSPSSSATSPKQQRVKAQKRAAAGSISLEAAMKKAAKRTKKPRKPIVLTAEDRAWTRHVDAGTGVPYFYNSISEQSVWEAPKGYLAAVKQAEADAAATAVAASSPAPAALSTDST